MSRCVHGEYPARCEACRADLRMSIEFGLVCAFLAAVLLLAPWALDREAGAERARDAHRIEAARTFGR